MTDELTIMSGFTFAQSEVHATVAEREDNSLAGAQNRANIVRMGSIQDERAVHAQNILNQAADNKHLEVLNLPKLYQQEVIKMEYSPGLIFRQNMGWHKELKMT